MKRSVAAFGILFFCIAGRPSSSLILSAPSSKFNSLVRSYFEAYGADDPLFADQLGNHKYDDRLPDLSRAGLARHTALLNKWRTRFARARIEAKGDRNVYADASAVLDSIDLELLETARLHPELNDPNTYVGTIGQAIYQLLSRDNQPLETRMRYAASRLTLIPGIVDDALANLQRPTPTAIKVAIERNPGNLELYKTELPAAAAKASLPTRALIAGRLPAALRAIARLQRFLMGPLKARSDGNPRVGSYIFNREMMLANGVEEPPIRLVARAHAAMRLQRRQMYELAASIEHSNAVAAPDDATISTTIRRVMNKLADNHPNRDQVFSTARADVDSLLAFLKATGVVPLPVPNTLVVAPTPAFEAGFAGASLDPAGPLTPLASSYYYIDQIPKSWPEQRVNSYLREYNAYEMVMLSIHEAVPGHYVQFRYNNTLPYVVRKMMANGAFAEGWAIYTEGMMLDAGYANNDPAQRLFQLKWRLREEANAIIDHDFHTGTLTEAQVHQFLSTQAFQEDAEIATKWRRLNLSHDQLSSYFAGYDAIITAQNAEKSRLGSAFNLAAFNKKLLDIGSVEPRFIKPLMQ